MCVFIRAFAYWYLLLKGLIWCFTMEWILVFLQILWVLGFLWDVGWLPHTIIYCERVMLWGNTSANEHANSCRNVNSNCSWKCQWPFCSNEEDSTLSRWKLDFLFLKYLESFVTQNLSMLTLHLFMLEGTCFILHWSRQNRVMSCYSLMQVTKMSLALIRGNAYL